MIIRRESSGWFFFFLMRPTRVKLLQYYNNSNNIFGGVRINDARERTRADNPAAMAPPYRPARSKCGAAVSFISFFFLLPAPPRQLTTPSKRGQTCTIVR